MSLTKKVLFQGDSRVTELQDQSVQMFTVMAVEPSAACSRVI